MVLSNDLINQFVKATKDAETKKTESIVYGTAKDQNGTMFVQFDGSSLMTPVISTADTKDGDRVTVMIKNHTAIITGNVSSPSARTHDVQNITADVDKDLSAINTALNNQINQTTAQGRLLTEHGSYLTSLDLRADNQEATVKDIKTVVDMIVGVAEKHDLDVGELVEFLYGKITELESKHDGDIRGLSMEVGNLITELKTKHANDISGLAVEVGDRIRALTSKHDEVIADIYKRIQALEQ